MSWYLENVYERNEESPYTFYVLSKVMIDNLAVGDLVKLIFVMEEQEVGLSAERMWVEITQINGQKFIGKLDNDPYRLQALKAGDEITFGMENICDTEYKDPDSADWDFYFDTMVIVSNDVLEKREFNFLLRDDSQDEGDSGWSIFSGYEDGDFQSDSKNFKVVSIGVILNIDDSILEFIDETPLCAYERNEDGFFVKIEDYDWEGYLNG
ncbi:DUF2185 domain-containing protein [Gottfriedia sp. NPDC057991]|uniref:immunity protein Imm33 domain-containing protein n=1 Tax=Gottfriedia sp. NPDC057991 TaxID=3346298 RepID=UPI0036D95404